MKDFGSITINEMLQWREAAELEVSRLIGKLVFSYSRFVTGLHYCVAWMNLGRDLDTYGSIAEDLVAATLIRKIERHAAAYFGEGSKRHKKFAAWTERAHALREKRNIVMHASWSIEAYGRHAIAVSTPVFVDPPRVITFSADDLLGLSNTCDQLTTELYRLRRAHPF
jgi:hypothetical protein